MKPRSNTRDIGLTGDSHGAGKGDANRVRDTRTFRTNYSEIFPGPIGKRVGYMGGKPGIVFIKKYGNHDPKSFGKKYESVGLLEKKERNIRAIFIGGTLHGKTKIVEPTHTRCAYHNQIGMDVQQSEIVEYHRRFLFGDTAIFVQPDNDDTNKLLIEAIERGLQLSAEPPLRQTIEMLFRVRGSHLFYGRAEDEAKNIDFLAEHIQHEWTSQQAYRHRKTT